MSKRDENWSPANMKQTNHHQGCLTLGGESRTNGIAGSRFKALLKDNDIVVLDVFRVADESSSRNYLSPIIDVEKCRESEREFRIEETAQKVSMV